MKFSLFFFILSELNNISSDLVQFFFANLFLEILLYFSVLDLSKHPVEGFSAGLVDDSNLFEWDVAIIGPPDTL